MAKRSTTKSGTSRVRFIMLEAVMPEGDLTEIMGAIQNALKPSTSTIQRVPVRPSQVLTSNMTAEDVAEAVEVETGEDEDELIEEGTPRSTKPRKPTSRKVLEIDLDTDVSLASYAEQYPPQSESERYLVVVAFFYENREIEEDVTADHVYTCFRKLGWTTGKKDFAQPLRNLKRDQLVEKGTSNGTYKTNHIGLDRVHKLASV